MKVTVLDDYQHAFESLPVIERLRQKAEVEILIEKLPTEEALAQALKDSQAIVPIRERTKFPAAVLQALPKLELISQTGGHAYHLDMAAATKAGILVAMAPGGTGASELTIVLMLAIMRRISQSDRAMRQDEWPLVLGQVLKGKTLGILGLGKVGSEVARIALAFGMKVVAWGPTLTPERAGKSQATHMTLEDVLRNADVVSVHLKLSEQSKGLLNEARLRLMKKSAYLVNTARGAIVDEQALAKILRKKRSPALHWMSRRGASSEKQPATQARQHRAGTSSRLADGRGISSLCREFREQHPRLFGGETHSGRKPRGAAKPPKLFSERSNGIDAGLVKTSAVLIEKFDQRLRR